MNLRVWMPSYPTSAESIPGNAIFLSRRCGSAFLPICCRNRRGIAALGPRLTRRLQERYSFSDEAAQWAIESWAVALSAEKMPIPHSEISAMNDVPTDRDVLVAFYHATNGANWSNSENWLSAAPLGTWYGVTTDRSGRVTVLSLQNSKLSGSIPEGLGNLSNLKFLNLSDNQLKGPIPPQLANLSNLKWLNLSSNQLSGPIPAEIRNLPNLKRLVLDGQKQRSGGIPLDRSNPAGQPTPTDRDVLVTLYHATNGPNWQNNENWLSDVPIGSWHGVTTDRSGRVTKLFLASNRLSGLIPPELGHLSNLTDLSLWNNELNGPIPSQLGNLANSEKTVSQKQSVERVDPSRIEQTLQSDSIGPFR